MKKLLSLIITAVMLLTMTVLVFATGSTPTVYVSSAAAAPGQEFDIDVCIKDNPGIVAINLQIEYPTDALELVSFTNGTLMSMTESNVSTGKVLLEATDINTNVTSNGTLFTVRFKVKEGTAKQGCTIGASVISANNSAVSYVTFTTQSGRVTVTDGRTPISIIRGTSSGDFKPAYGAAATKPDLMVTEGAPAYFDIDSRNGWWYKKNADGSRTKLSTDDTFTEGTYYFSFQMHVDGTAGTTHMLSNAGVKVYIDGTEWKTTSPNVGDTFSYAWVTSPDYVVTDPSATHNLIAVPGEEATCTSEGRKTYYACGSCGLKFKDAEGLEELTDESWLVIPMAHRFGEWKEEVAATTEKEGTKAHKDCDFCGNHFDKNGVEIADITIAKLSGGEENPGGETNPPSEGKGLSDGAIVGIVAGGVAVVGIGGFAIIWFAIKKKTFADLITAIKILFKKK